MLPPLLRIMINEPRLLTEHAEAYFHLIVKEAHLWQAANKRRLMLKLVTGGSLFLTLLFTGIALMIWGATQNAHWTLIVVPLVSLVVFIALIIMLANDAKPVKPFEATKKQLCNDINMFKEAKNG